MASALSVEMGETGISRLPEARLQATGLGACVGLCLYDPVSRIAALVHIVLPQTLTLSALNSRLPVAAPLPGKCADTALGHVLAQMQGQGGQAARIRAALVGGAQIFSSNGAAGTASLSRLEIGPRNIAAVKAALAESGIPLLAEETGGHCGRTVTLHVGTGDLWVRRIGLEEQLLVGLGLASAVSAQCVGGALSYGL